MILCCYRCRSHAFNVRTRECLACGYELPEPPKPAPIVTLDVPPGQRVLAGFEALR